jgi:UDPglucose 6-dehydrogenase
MAAGERPLKVTVLGLWHLGTVTAACLAAEGHEVVAIDEAPIVSAILSGALPVDEPGLADLIRAERETGRLTFASGPGAAAGSDLLWVCYDTPVDDNDRPDVESVLQRTSAFLNTFPGKTVVAVSSQLPVGSIAALEASLPTGRLHFAAIPENLRLGSAIAYFRAPDRFVAGVRDDVARNVVAAVVAPFCASIVWMSVESAEMTKHAINAFLATSVTFANELAAMCERVGADARDVERGLKSDLRIGPKAYVRAGEAFAGGTLARDLSFLAVLADREGLPLEQTRATARSNEHHRDWAFDRLMERLPSGRRRVGLLGVVYKPGTDTLRASTAVALARRLDAEGVEVVAFDPAVAVGDKRMAGIATLTASAGETIENSDAVVVATAWPEFLEIPVEVFQRMRTPLVIDVARFLEARLAGSPVTYVAFGRPSDSENHR